MRIKGLTKEENQSRAIANHLVKFLVQFERFSGDPDMIYEDVLTSLSGVDLPEGQKTEAIQIVETMRRLLED